jgi:peptidoglycan/xylan/chitin deacetylase (PgdA/CDA1 family)
MYSSRLTRFVKKIPILAANLWENPALVLNYHRVAQVPVDPHGMVVSPETFAWQLKHLKKRYVSLSYQQFAECVAQRKAFPKNSFLLTFDDGYRDNLTEAWPILKSHGLEAIFNITTGNLGTNTLFWWDRLAYSLLAGERCPTRLELRIDGFEFVADTSSDICRRAAHDRLYQLLKQAERNLRDRVLEALEVLCPVDPSLTLAARCLDEVEVKSLSQENGAYIGAHARSHTPLAY